MFAALLIVVFLSHVRLVSPVRNACW